MNRYVQLCEANAVSIKHLISHKTECAKFVRRFTEGFIEHLRCPFESIQVFNLKNGFNRRYPCSSSHAIILEADGFWHFGLAVSLQRAEGVDAQPVLFNLSIKKDHSFFIIKIKETNETFRVQPTNKRQLTTLYAAIIHALEDLRRNAAHQRDRTRTTPFYPQMRYD